MALDQSALLEVLKALKGADVEDRIRHAAETTLLCPVKGLRWVLEPSVDPAG
jgi:hypothetical protein